MTLSKLAKGQHVYTSFGVSAEVVDYSETMHSATIKFSDGSQTWVAAETLTPVEEADWADELDAGYERIEGV